MSTFLGIGLGPIQTGIFMAGADKGGFSRIVMAEVNDELKNAVNNSGGHVTINIAAENHVYQETYSNVEVFNPSIKAEQEKLIEAASEADEIATALPSVEFFQVTAKWLLEGFLQNPAKHRFIYTAENDNHAAEKLEKSIAKPFADTYYLNTVINKMSKVATAEECSRHGLEMLCPAAGRGHLVEEFNKILISRCDGIETRQVKNLYVKDDLYPFEEAKLYGNNAIHFLLGTFAKTAGKKFISELRQCPELLDKARTAFIDECGSALIKKWAGFDELFTTTKFKEYAEELLIRMTNPFLRDTVARITRDVPRKLGWEDRVIGTMRLLLSQKVQPDVIAEGAALAAAEEFGADKAKVISALTGLWPAPWTAEHQKVMDLILEKVK
ncbi:hypothetical protein P0136_10075 [Lentisphaerota bacterium ZTH]|nr:hypothetical protein JYG24_12415 [Lentisphaerota bacterium]WET05707.1 hypothetical protein P0136_10075 [Lentisphaerota bacterium ZTH]